MIDITKAEEDRIINLLGINASLSQICKVMNEEFPEKKWYPMMLSRIVRSIKYKGREAIDLYSEIEEDLEDIKDWLYEKENMTALQRSSYSRKLNKVKRKIKDAISISFQQESLDTKVNTALVDFNREILEPIMRKHPFLKKQLSKSWDAWEEREKKKRNS